MGDFDNLSSNIENALSRIQTQLNLENQTEPLEIILTTQSKPSKSKSVDKNKSYYKDYILFVSGELIVVGWTMYKEFTGNPHEIFSPKGDLPALESIHTCLEYVMGTDPCRNDLVKTDNFSILYSEELDKGVPISRAIEIIELNIEEYKVGLGIRKEKISYNENISPVHYVIN